MKTDTIVLPPAEEEITFIFTTNSHEEEVGRITSEGIYVNGKKLLHDDSKVKAAYNAFVANRNEKKIINNIVIEGSNLAPPDTPKSTWGIIFISDDSVLNFYTGTTGEIMLKISPDGFYVRGKKLEQDESEARAVYDAFMTWLNEVKSDNCVKPDAQETW
jgi:hypothetical protein